MLSLLPAKGNILRGIENRGVLGDVLDYIQRERKREKKSAIRPSLI